MGLLEDVNDYKDATAYWTKRYEVGMGSGIGSRGQLAHYKAEFVNDFIRDHAIGSLIDLGCGDGHIAAMLQVERYLGLDIVPSSIGLCRSQFGNRPDMTFTPISAGSIGNFEHFLSCDLSLSMDVSFHIVDEAEFAAHVRRLCMFTSRYAILYSSRSQETTRSLNGEAPRAHKLHRDIVAAVQTEAPDFRYLGEEPHPYPEESQARFHIFERG